MTVILASGQNRIDIVEDDAGPVAYSEVFEAYIPRRMLILHLNLLAQHGRSDHIVGHENEHARNHNRGGRCIGDRFGPHAVTPPVRIISLIAADQRYQQREHKRLDKPFRDVGHQDTALYAVEIGAFINAQQQYAGQVAPDDPDHIKNGRQKRKSYQRSDKTGRDQIPHAGDIHDFQRIDLIRDAHDPDFSGHGRARTPRDHDGRQGRDQAPG